MHYSDSQNSKPTRNNLCYLLRDSLFIKECYFRPCPASFSSILLSKNSPTHSTHNYRKVAPNCSPTYAVYSEQSMLSFWPSFLLLLAYAGLAKPAQGIHGSRSSTFLDKNIFVLAGQSNMAGRGGVYDDIWDGIVPSESESNSQILKLNSRHKWVEAREPLHIDIDVNKTCGIGPGMPFANTLREMESSMIGVVGLVPCAVGGTNMSEWEQGTFLYNELVRRSKASLKEGGRIRAILWYQGESDTIIQEDAEAYGESLKQLILHLRDDLELPMLPFIQVALASGEGPFVEIVRQAQLELDLPNVWCVDAYGLPLESDGLHLTTQSQVRLGQMLAENFFTKTVQRQSLPISNNASKRTHYFL